MSRNAQKSAATVANKWSQNLGSSGPQMIAGAQAVTVSPTQLAAANQTGYLAGVQNAVSSGRWAQSLQNVTLGQWQAAYVGKAVPRVQASAVSDKPKVQAAFQKLLPVVYGIRDQINSQMPRGTLQQNLQRSAAFATAMNAAKMSGQT